MASRIAYQFAIEPLRGRNARVLPFMQIRQAPRRGNGARASARDAVVAGGMRPMRAKRMRNVLRSQVERCCDYTPRKGPNARAGQG